MKHEIAGKLPVAVIGAGPIGLAAAAHLVVRGITPIVFERGATAGHAILSWGHVSLFSPWKFNIDPASRALLEQHGWKAPNGEDLPTGEKIVQDYLQPLVSHPAISPNIRYEAQVISVARKGVDKITNAGREEVPFVITWKNKNHEFQKTDASAVIDASGTWFSPNPLGVNGIQIDGEANVSQKLVYGIPDVLGASKANYANKRVLVTGGGHSAINVVLDLLRLQKTASQTQVIWSLRRNRLDRLFGGGLNDKFPARGALGLAAKQAIEEKRLQLLVPFEPQSIHQNGTGLLIQGVLDGKPYEFTVDQAVVATGFRPDLGIVRELRVSVDPILEAPPALAPLIDPNYHSCGTVPPHGVEQLSHPEPGFYIVGSKSYGRAPTFLMATGYEQVRSVVAAIAGDHDAAGEIRLALPETGVCSVSIPLPGCCEVVALSVSIAPQIEAIQASSSCCGGPSPADDGACCLKDHHAKAEGLNGCGCDTKPSSASQNDLAP